GLYEPLSPGEYIIKVSAANRTKPGGLEEAESSIPLAVNSPYSPPKLTSLSRDSRAERQAPPPGSLPFMGTDQPTVIKAYGDVSVGGAAIFLEGYLITIEEADINGDGIPDIVAGGDTLFAYDIKNAQYIWAIDESSLQLASEIDDIAIADITGDGVPDVVTIDYYDPDETFGSGSDGLCLWDGSDGTLLWSVDMDVALGANEMMNLRMLDG
ncbi:MAG: VCBS repeat-containing protein, partial [Deltaproteobacteria bacterium]|nr:VCBS repeat-containing protein [Deltaproteobacteria bacterium]